MSITVTDLAPMVYDPVRMQQLVLNNISNFEIMDPTNPFVMLLEAATSISSASAAESVASIKKLYPSLASTTDDLLHHVSDKEIKGLFSHPAETNLIIYLNVRELKTNGVDPVDPNTGVRLGYYETVLPAYTEIVVANIPFTLLNDITIRLYDSGVVFVEQGISIDPVASNRAGILASGIVNFPDSEPWVMLEVLTKQVKRNIVVRPVTVSEGFKVQIKHSDKYHFSEVFFNDTSTGNTWTRLEITHSDSYINPIVPTVFITTAAGMVTYEIPDVYLVSGQVSGEIKIVMYETQGSLDLPIYKYPMSEYIVTPAQTPMDIANAVSAATVSNITMYSNSRDTVNGGKTGYTFPELKQAIINNTLGHDVMPVTETQLARLATVQGFEIHKALDIITNRIYTANRNMSKYNSDLLYSRADTFFNTVSLEKNAINNSNVVVDTNYIMIPSNVPFKEVNGVVSIMSDSEVAIMAVLPDQELVRYLAKNNIFSTLYHYFIDTTSTNVTTTRVFDLDAPTLGNIRIIGKNTNIVERANIGKYGIVRTSTGYDIVFTVITNSDFDNRNTNLVFGQLRVPTFDNGSTISIPGVYDSGLKTLTFKLDTKFNISKSNTLEITNGITDITTPLMLLSDKAKIFIYTEDPALVDSTNYYRSDIATANNQNNVTVIDVETIDIRLGRVLDHIWNRLFITYNNNKYARHQADKLRTYATNIYKTDPVTGSTIIVDPITNVTSKVLLHTAGDPVLDGNGNQIYEYRKGDVILDSNQLPTIDMAGGVVWNMDILMLEYEYVAANSLPAINYLKTIRDTLNGWMFNDMAIINAKVIENTSVVYKSYKSTTPVDLTVESARVVSPYKVSPIVTLYSTTAKYSSLEISNLRTIIGGIIHDHLDKPDVRIDDLKAAIISATDSAIVSAKIENIELSKNSAIFSVTDPTSRLTLNKALSLSPSNNLEVNYDVTVKVFQI